MRLILCFLFSSRLCKQLRARSKVAMANASTIRSKKKNEKRAVARKRACEARKAEAEEAARGAEAVKVDEREQ